jgi:hypothetical protein
MVITEQEKFCRYSRNYSGKNPRHTHTFTDEDAMRWSKRILAHIVFKFIFLTPWAHCDIDDVYCIF